MSFYIAITVSVLQMSTINASVPLVWDLSDKYNISLQSVRDGLTSNMGCCDCV